MLDAKPGVGTGESRWKADASVGTVVKSTVLERGDEHQKH
jgi:hypothetical protein